MLPEKISRPSLKKYWHIIVLLLATTLAISSETATFLLGSNSVVIFFSSEDHEARFEERSNRDNGRQARNDLDARVFSAIDIRILPSANVERFCSELDKSECRPLNSEIKLAIFILLVICAFRYWAVDIKNQELLDLYRKISEYKSKLDTLGIGGYSLADLRNMRMKSRSYYAYIILEPETTSVKSAVIVFESLSKRRFNKRMLNSLLRSDAGNMLKHMVFRRSIQSSSDLDPTNVS